MEAQEEELRKFSLSLDVSTTNVGIALWNEVGGLEELKHIELKVDKTIAEEDRYIYKADLLKRYLQATEERVLSKYYGKIHNIFIEAPLSNTPRNINTTALLLGFNGIACFILYEVFNVVPKKISVHDARKIFCPEFIKTKVISRGKRKGVVEYTLSFPKKWTNTDKKEYIRKKVAELEPQVQWFYTRNNTIRGSSHDMSDAYAVGYAGLKVLEII